MGMCGHFVVLTLLTGCLCLAALAGARAEPNRLDLTHAVIVAPPGQTGPESKAVAMLVEEVEKRTRIHWPVVSAWPSGSEPVLLVGRSAALSSLLPKDSAHLTAEKSRPGHEGYSLRVGRAGARPVVVTAGRDARGVLFGVGRLLRLLHTERDHITIDADIDLQSTPRYPLRGHQLGYRPKTNSYDGWTAAMWEQYIRDLAVFGANAVELIPPRSDDDADSPHFPLPPMEMMVRMSRLLDDYGLDCWIWYPAMDPDYTNAGTVETALKEWGEVFRRLPRVDAVFVPGGDPGHTQPKVLMALLEKQAASLRKYHPKAQMWVSPQGFTAEWMDEFLKILNDEHPAWLTGIVFGPQVRLSLPQLRVRVPKQYPIRHYPDITHTRQCEYPVPQWDVAYALTEGREPINPRPLDQARIFHSLQKDTIGFLTYSEGCNDDVNKAVWSALGWNPDMDITEILREYSRYFISDRYADGFAQGLLALERNWNGPLTANEGVLTTLQQFQAMERSATPQEKLNWRFQQALYRAYYDAYLHSRLLYENGLEEQAMERLRAARKSGSLAAMTEAEAVLDQAVSHPVAGDLRARVFELAEALFQSIRMQLSVERYQAIAVERGANLDSIDAPLNNRRWLLQRFAEIRSLPQEADRLKALEEIVHWTDPGPGGFYDEPGNPLRRPHLVAGKGFGEDPGSYESPRIGFSSPPNARLSWMRHAESLYDAPLQLRYYGLDPNASYKVRVVYAGDSPQKRIRLTAGDPAKAPPVEIHPLMSKPQPVHPLEFDIPAQALSQGELLLTWQGEPGLGGNGRCCQVSEVWLIRK